MSNITRNTTTASRVRNKKKTTTNMESSLGLVGRAVRMNHDSEIPQRYRGRTAQVSGATKTARGIRYFISFGQRRKAPLPASRKQFSVIS